MEHLPPPILANPAANTTGRKAGDPAALAAGSAKAAGHRILALCDDHLTREEMLLADVLLSLQQVRDAFFQRNLRILPSLQIRQKQLAQEATELAAARERLRAALADWLGVGVPEATLRAVALSLPADASDRLLQRRRHLAAMLREIEQLSQQNAALLGYARGFFACLFSEGRIANPASLRYGRQGQPHDGICSPLLEARV